jgi:CubicO group peptidase (beta-lactamase class C family)
VRSKVAILGCAVLAVASAGPAAGLPAQPPAANATLARTAELAIAGSAALPRLRAVIVAHAGEVVIERRYHGPALDAPVNIKSASKTVISALVGIAIAEGKLQGVDQAIGPFFQRYLRGDPDLRKREITIGDLLSMRSGLERTSGENYSRWVSSGNWVKDALRRPLLYPPGTQMLYSTGNTHLLSAILTQATGRSTLRYAQQKLGKPLGIHIGPWKTDPQGIYFGGNQMYMSPRAMLRFGELYRNGGRYGGKQVVPEAWVAASTEPRTRSPFSGEQYGYCWFISEVRGHRMFYAWGHGGQFIFVVPDLELTIATTSQPDGPRDFEHLGGIYSSVVEPMAALFGADLGTSR